MPTPRSPTPGACGTGWRATVDVATLDDWLDRSAGYDIALRELYDGPASTAMAGSTGGPSRR